MHTMTRTTYYVEKTLTALEKFFKTDVRGFAKQGAWSSLGKIGTAAIAFLLSILYARYLSKELYGSYRYVASVLGMLALFSLSDLGSIITRAVARGFDGTAARGIKIIFFSSCGIGVASGIASVWFFWQGDTALGGAFLISALISPAVEGLGGWRPYLDGKKDFRTKALRNVGIQIFYAALVASAIAIITLEKLSLAPALGLFLAATLLGNAIPNLLFSRQILSSIARVRTTQEPGAIRYGLHLSLIKIPATIANYIDSVLLYTYLGPAQLALYSFALAPTEQMKNLLGNIADIALPHLSERTVTHEGTAQMRATLPKKLAKAILPTLALMLTYIALAPFFFSTFFPRYVAAIPFSQILALSLVFFPLGIFGTAIKAEGHIKSVYIYELCPPLIQILAFVILIPLYGLWGAVIGKLLGRLINNIVQSLLYMYARF